MSACQSQALAALSIETWEHLRNEDSFNSIWYLIKRDEASLKLPEPTILSKKLPNTIAQSKENWCLKGLILMQ